MTTTHLSNSIRQHSIGSPPMRPSPRRLGWIAALGVLTWIVLLAGCATIGQEFNVAAVDQIVIGQTTRADVERMFGSPWRVGVEDGNPTWTYGHYKYKLFGRAKTRDLVIRFDDRNVVRSFTFNTTEREDRPQQ